MSPPHALEQLYSTEPPGPRALRLVILFVALELLVWLVAR
jgi:hypothetical protein